MQTPTRSARQRDTTRLESAMRPARTPVVRRTEDTTPQVHRDPPETARRPYGTRTGSDFHRRAKTSEVCQGSEVWSRKAFREALRECSA